MSFRFLRSIVLVVLSSVSAFAALSEAFRVVSLHTVLTEIAREVGGDEVDVFALVRAGADPHLFEPAPADLRRLSQSHLVLAAGLGLESYLPRLASEIGKDRLVEVGNRLPGSLKLRAHVFGHDSDHGEIDPHWWHGISQVIAAVDIVENEFIAHRPSSKSAFVRNASAYRARLRALNAWIVAELSLLPATQRHLVTTHDAFGYFAHEHTFTVHPLLGLSTAADADARHIAALVDLIRARKIKAVFAERSTNPRMIETILRETGARLGGSLFADGLGAGSSGATYEAMVRHNVDTIVSGLR